MLRDSLKRRIEDVTTSKSYGPEILHGLIEKESSYRPNAKSKTGVKGLCQITKQTAKELMENYEFSFSAKDMLKPENQIEMASVRLEEMMSKIGSRYPKITEAKKLELALHAYNSGYSSVCKAVSKGGFNKFKMYLPNTADKEYADKVVSLSKSWTPSPVAVTHVDIQKHSSIPVNFYSVSIIVIFTLYLVKKYYSVKR